MFRSTYGFELPVYDTAQLPWSVGSLYRDHHQVLDFVTDRLASIHNDFVDAFHENCKVPVCGFYADAAREQSAWYGTRDLVAIFGNCDMIYSSEGEYEDPTKLMAADLHKGTFPTMTSIIEYDPTDSGALGGKMEKPIDPESVQRHLTKAIQRGVELINWAMAYGENQIEQLAAPVAELRKGVKLPKPTEPITVDISKTLYSGDNLYQPAWEAAGGKDKPTPIRSVNSARS